MSSYLGYRFCQHLRVIPAGSVCSGKGRGQSSSLLNSPSRRRLVCGFGRRRPMSGLTCSGLVGLQLLTKIVDGALKLQCSALRLTERQLERLCS